MKTCHTNMTSASLVLLLATGALMNAQSVVYKPYIQSGDASTFGAKDQMVVAWQTDEIKPGNSAFTVDYGTTASYSKTVNPTCRIVNNYLSANPSLPVP